MTQRLPNDRVFVDLQRKILDHWHGVFKGLEQLLQITPEDFATLQAMIRAAQETEEEGETTNIFELPINTEPLPSEDYFIGWKTSDRDARRFPILSLLSATTLISTTTMSGASVDITIPEGYTDVKLIVKGVSTNSGGMKVQWSEDGASSFVTQTFRVWNAANVQTSSDWYDAESVATGNGRYGVQTLHDYAGLENKLVDEHDVNSDSAGWVGCRFLTSTAAINTVRYSTSAGSFDAGTVELWGIP